LLRAHTARFCLQLDGGRGSHSGAVELPPQSSGCLAAPHGFDQERCELCTPEVLEQLLRSPSLLHCGNLAPSRLVLLHVLPRSNNSLNYNGWPNALQPVSSRSSTTACSLHNDGGPRAALHPLSTQVRTADGLDGYGGDQGSSHLLLSGPPLQDALKRDQYHECRTPHSNESASSHRPAHHCLDTDDCVVVVSNRPVQVSPCSSLYSDGGHNARPQLVSSGTNT